MRGKAIEHITVLIRHHHHHRRRRRRRRRLLALNPTPHRFFLFFANSFLSADPPPSAPLCFNLALLMCVDDPTES
jgi:hypothetical protein